MVHVSDDSDVDPAAEFEERYHLTATEAAELAENSYSMVSYQGKDWIETFTGRQFLPMRPDWRVFNFFDMAHALAYKCRYNGHTQKFYSVAEHCCLLVRHAHSTGRAKDSRTLLELAMHDCPETYFPDVSRPLKQFCPELVRAEKVVGLMIRNWVGLEGPEPDLVHELDSRIIVDERRDVMSSTSPHVWSTDTLKALDIPILCWSPQEAEHQWITMATALASTHMGRQVFWTSDYTGTASPDNPLVRTEDVLAADLLGNVGLVRRRGGDGMLLRDRNRARAAAVQTEFMHGKFTLSV